MFNSQHQLLDMSSSAQRTPENELDFLRDESGNENMEAPNSGDDQADPNQPPNKKKRYHRHTQHQIQEMEAFYKECNHPDDKQRKELGIKLGLEPLQVKFWFQNKRTQMKAQHERSENAQLRNENEKLRAENSRYKEALNNAICPNCGGPASVGEMSFDEQHLRIENARLRDEIDRITGVAGGYVGKSSLNFPPHQLPPPEAPRCMDVAFGPQSSLHGEMFPSGDLLRMTAVGLTDAEKPMVIELAVTAMEELVRMAQTEEPLWMPTSGIISTETLCEQEYARMFPRGIGPKSSTLSSEATRETAVVIMNHINLVEILMDVNKWTCVFAGIVSKAMTLEVLSTGVAGNHNGALQVMTAEFQVPSPLVPTRENYFVRYCKQHAEGTWAVVDISLENLRSTAVSRYRRRPSGCLIEELQNGYSRVTWVEHVEVDERAVHDIYKPLVNSGIAFGAKRWVATLDRQCERLASAMANNVSTGDTDLLSNPAGRKSMLKLAERMVTSFCAGVGSSTAHVWTVLSGSGSDDVRVMTRKSVADPGRPAGIVLSAATSFWLPVSPRRVFDFLRDENSRSQWDILSNGGIVQEMSHIANGRDPGNCVSLLRVNSGTNFNQSNMLILQESVTDPTGSYVIYAPVDTTAMNLVLSGGDPDYAALLPSGFAILPDGPMNHDGGNSEIGPVGGSLLTVAFQILVDSVPTAKLSLGSIATVNSLIKCTVKKIKEAVTSENAP